MPLYSIQGPDGRTYSIEGPPGATREQVIRAIQARMQEPAQAITAPPAPQSEESGILRQALDIPLQVVRGGVGGIRMLADLFGAGSSASEALKSADTWLADLLSSQAKNDQRRIAEILKEAEDKGVLAQVGAGLRALATAPVDTLAQALGSTAPVIIAGLASGPVGAALGVARAGAVAMPAVGAAMGVGEVKGSIYEAVEQAYKEKGASDEIARAKALEAQAYASSNLPSMVAAGGLGAIAGGMGIERPLASMLSRGAVKDVAEQQALRDAERGLLPRVGLGALREGAPEFAQAGQSQLAQNIALRSEGFDVPLFRNVFGAGAMEGAAGAILGGGLAVPRTGVERLPGQQEGESDAAFARRMSREIDAARRAEQPLAPVTQPVAPTEPVVSTAPEGEDVFRLPDGSVGTLDQVRAYAMNLPPEQRASTLQSILAQRVPREKTVPPDLFTQTATQTATQPAEGAAPTTLPLTPVETAEKPATEIPEQAKPTETKPAQAETKEEEQAAADEAQAEQASEQHAVAGYPVIELPLAELTLSKDVPQFKSDADAKGVVEALGGTFDRRGVAPIQVWKRNDGRMEVISGRHRLDLAQRSGEQTIPAQIHEEATGFDAKQAAMLDAELNIRDQQGKVKDYVAYFENAGIPEADADARGLLARAPGKQGFAIATKGSPELVAAHRADVIPDAGAAAIANAAPGDSRLQAVGIKAIQEGKSPLAAVNTIKAVQAISKDRPPTEGGDLFGFDDSAMREAEEMAKIATLKQNQIAQRLAAISGASRRPEIAKKEGIDIKDPDALKKREKELRQQKASWDNWPSSPELVEEIRKEMEPKAEKPAEVSGEIKARASLRDAIQETRAFVENSLADWKSRAYKANKKTVELSGEGPRKRETMAVGEINENRRRRAIENLNEELNVIKSLERKTATDDGADAFLKKARAVYKQAEQAVKDGVSSFATAGEAFEYLLLNETLNISPAGRGAYSSNSISKAVRKIIESEPAVVKEEIKPVQPTTPVSDEDILSLFSIAERAQKPSVREAAPAKEVPPAIQAKIDALGKALQRIMSRYGLRDVALRLVADMKAEGEYASKVLSLALDAADPVVALRHEAIHAMKELGFFSPAQWKSLERQAKEKWVDQYLKKKNVNRQPLQEGQLSRYDAYMKFYGGDQEAILEEAIADAFADFSATKAPPGMLQALLKRIQNFFQAIKEAFGAEPDAERIFKKAERGELRGKEVAAPEVAEPEEAKPSLRQVPLSTRGIMESSPVYAMDELGLKTTSEKKPGGIELFNDVRSIARALNNDTINREGAIKEKDYSIASALKLARAMADEISFQVGATAKTGTGLGWYSSNYPKSVKKLAKRFPELETDPYARTVFSALVAITSNGEKVATNVKNAISLYADIREGKAVVQPGSRRASAMENNLSTLKMLMDKFGPDLRAELMREITVKEMNAALRAAGEKPDTSYLADTKVPASAIYFGPKLGAFFSNLEGAEGYLTMDLWWTRTMNRMRGLLMPKATAASINKFRELMDRPNATREEVVSATIPLRNKYEEFGFKTELEHLVGSKEPSSKSPDLPKWNRRARALAGPAYQQLVFEHRLEKLANTIHKNEFEMLEEAPFTASDRKFMYRTAREAQRMLRDNGIDLSLADIQAALWYYEKRLYQHLSGRKADDIGYDEAIEQLAGQSSGPAGPALVFNRQPAGGPGSAGAGTEADRLGGAGQAAKPSLRDKLGLYSELESKVSQGPGKGTAEAWKGYINGLTQKGVKPEEIEWSGVRDWLDLQKGSVTKEDLLAYLKNGGVQVEEVVLRDSGDDIPFLDSAAKYRKYTLPGGENYREVLLTLPNATGGKEWKIRAGGGGNQTWEKTFTSEAEFNEYVQGLKADGIPYRVKTKGADTPAYRSAHWDQPNVLAHIRVNDRTDADGNKVLFVEEIQSDWGQEGKKHGFKYTEQQRGEIEKQLIDLELKKNRVRREGFKVPQDGERIEDADPRFLEYQELQRQYDAVEKQLEDRNRPAFAPFVATRKFAVFKGGKEFTRTDKEGKEVKQRYDSMEAAEAAAKKVDGEARDLGLQANTEGWLNLALKRIMVMAGEGGYDKVAFVNGDQSAERYDLSKQVDSISYEPTAKGYSINVMAGGRNVKYGNFTRSELEDIVGVEIVKKMDTREGKQPFDPEVEPDLANTRELSGVDLKIGGEGMKTFYDTIVPTAVKKLLPKVGGGQMAAVKMGEGARNLEVMPHPDDPDGYAIQDIDDGQWYDPPAEQFRNEAPGRMYRSEARARAQIDYIVKSAAPVLNQPGFDVTPAMKERVRTTGLPRFSLRDTVNVDGTERPTTSSTNKPIYPTEEGTKNFWKWFKDSVVVDGEGRPLVVYHGTFNDFTMFDARRAGENTEGNASSESYAQTAKVGFWFSSEPMAGPKAGYTVDMPVYLAIKNPKREMNLDWLAQGLERMTGQEYREQLISEGYDGIVLDDEEFGGTSYVAFEPTQIKSAIGNVGKFDPVDPNIKASLRDVIDPAIRARIDQTTTPREEKTFIKRITDAIAPKSASSFRAAFLDRYNRLSEYDKELTRQMGGAPLLADASSHSAALMSDLSAGVLAGAMGVHDGVGGIPVYVNGYTKIVNNNNTVKGPIAIFAPLAKLGDPTAYQAYQFWAGVKRGTRFDREGREQLFEKADIQKADDLRKQFLAMGVDFEAIQKEWIKFNDGLVQYLKDTGVLSDAAAKEFVKYSDYIPFYRQADGEETVGPQIFASLSGVRAPKKLKGSETPIAEFLETVVRNVQYSIEAGMKNVAAQRAVNTAVAIGQANRLNYVSSAPNVVKVLENGKTSYYETKDLLFVEAMKSLNLGDLPFIGLLAGPANLLRNLVTKDPAFMLANMMRDSMSAWVSSGVKMTPFVDTLTNFTKALRNQNPEYSALLNSGVIGGYDYSQGVEISARRFDRALRKEAGVYTPAEKLARPFTSLWDALEKGTTASDAATRMEVYKKTLAETGNEAEALFRAVEVMNFNRKGNNPLVRVLTAAVPFLNARMQGLDVLYRAAFGRGTEANAKDIQKSFFIRGMTIAALSTMYWMLASEDDEWKRQEQETRDNYWILGDVKIPIPFEIGVLFKVIPERILEYSFGDDTGKDFLKSMTRQLTSTLSFNPIPQTALPLIESVTNYSFFTGRPIVSQGLEDVNPAYQIAPGTSRIGELIGGATKDLPTALQLSPVKIDEMIRGYTGTIGGYMMDLFDAIYDMNTDAPKAAKRFEQMPVIRRFAVDPLARGQVTAYYELKNSVDEAVRTANLLERNMKPQEWGEFMQENMGLLATKDYVLDLEKSMKQYREMKNFVRAAPMSAEEKKDIIANITELENNLASNIQEIKKMIDAQ